MVCYSMLETLRKHQKILMVTFVFFFSKDYLLHEPLERGGGEGRVGTGEPQPKPLQAG